MSDTLIQLLGEIMATKKGTVTIADLNKQLRDEMLSSHRIEIDFYLEGNLEEVICDKVLNLITVAKKAGIENYYCEFLTSDKFLTKIRKSKDLSQSHYLYKFLTKDLELFKKNQIAGHKLTKTSTAAETLLRWYSSHGAKKIFYHHSRASDFTIAKTKAQLDEALTLTKKITP